MPTSATHITVVRRIAASAPHYRALMGDPDPALPPSDPAAQRMRFASFGSCGPDFLYALMDYGPEAQDLENILVTAAATFEGLYDLMDGIQQRVDGVLSTITMGVSDSIKQQSLLMTALIQQSLLATVASGGLNPFAFFESRRQVDRPREEWFWADVLHYWRSGRFAEALVREARQTGNPNLLAYAYGYATHYVTDVVGHPFVNQVVGAPWRLYWQRHHLVENFMDAYVWDRWQTPVGVGAMNPPLDRVAVTPNAIGTGAPLGYSRLHRHIDIGAPLTIDPVDKIISDVAMQLDQVFTNFGLALPLTPDPPTDADAVAWSEMFVRAMHNTYDGYLPTNLMTPFLLGNKQVSRPDGFPTADDVAAAYGAFRLILRVTTEERVFDPQPPAIVSDISAAIAQIGTNIAQNLGGVPPPPSIPTGGAFNPAAILDALEKAVEWAGKVAEAVVNAAVDFISDTIAAGLTVVNDTVKYALWLINKALFALYRSFRDVLTLRGYFAPYTDQIAGSFGTLAATSLWQSPGNPASGTFPHEETVPAQRTVFPSSYVPTTVPTAPAEQPSVDFVAPYAPAAAGTTVPPDAFIDAPLGPDDMFIASGPQAPLLDGAGNPIGIRADPKNFGGAIENSKHAVDAAAAGNPAFPDYNLDADRAYAWPCWDVEPRPFRTGGTTGPVTAGNPLDPAANPPSGVATVNAVVLN